MNCQFAPELAPVFAVELSALFRSPKVSREHKKVVKLVGEKGEDWTVPG